MGTEPFAEAEALFRNSIRWTCLYSDTSGIDALWAHQSPLRASSGVVLTPVERESPEVCQHDVRSAAQLRC
jgi:hypothetical protein